MNQLDTILRENCRLSMKLSIHSPEVLFQPGRMHHSLSMGNVNSQHACVPKTDEYYFSVYIILL